MVLTISTNTAALNVQRNLNEANQASASSLAKLSSGSRVPTAKDDAASLAIGSRVEAEIAGLNQASTNASQATSLLQIADGAYGEINDILVRQSSLAIQSSSGQLSDSERAILDSEFQQLNSEVDRIAADTKFNGEALINGDTAAKGFTGGSALAGRDAELKGVENLAHGDTVKIAMTTAGKLTVTVTHASGDSDVFTPDAAAAAGTSVSTSSGLTIEFGAAFDATSALDTTLTASNTAATPASKSFSFKVGTGVDAEDTITTTISAANTTQLGTNSSAIDTKANADTAITAVGNAINKLQDSRALVGASLSRLDFASSNLAVTIENQSAAKSGLMDVDIAAESTNFAAQQVVVQAGVSLLSQANQQPSQLLSLLRG